MLLQRMFRVFVSSTFKDFEAEREVLEHYVFPDLEKYCNSKGAQFSGIDLRWGISSERASGNQTLTTCLEEIRRCQELSPRPNFLVLLGQRYGWQPLPERIPDELFRKLISADRQSKPDADSLLPEHLQDWYRKDENAHPPEWLLKPNNKIPRVVSEDEFSERSARLRAALAERWPSEPLFRQSATHQEIVRGCLGREGSEEHVVVWNREFTDSSNTGSAYLDTEAGPKEALESLREQLQHKLRGTGRFMGATCTKVDLDAGSDQASNGYLQTFRGRVTEALKRLINHELEDHRDDLDTNARHLAFARRYAEGVVGRSSEIEMLRGYLETDAEKPYLITGAGGSGKTGLLARFVADHGEAPGNEALLARFVGADSSIGSAQDLLESLWPKEQVGQLCEDHARGATQSDSKFMEWWENWCDNFRHSVRASESQAFGDFSMEDSFNALRNAMRKQSTDLHESTASLRNELHHWATRYRDSLIHNMEIAFDQPREHYLCVYLEAIASVYRSCGRDKTVLVLDALDELRGTPKLAELVQRIGHGQLGGSEVSLPDDVWMIAGGRGLADSEDLHGLDDDWCQKIIDKRLGTASRTVTTEQSAWLKRVYTQTHGNPLALTLAVKRALCMHSWTTTPAASADVRSLINDLFDTLGDAAEHGILAKCAIGYLALARDGLPEDILLDALANDHAVQTWFADQSRHAWSLAERGLPPVLWSRLYLDLSPYLVVAASHGTPVLRFFHREFHDLAREIVADSELRVKMAANLAERAQDRLQVAHGAQSGDATSLAHGPLTFEGWVHAELPWFLEQARRESESLALLCSPTFVLRKMCIPSGVTSLYEDYARHPDLAWSQIYRRHYAEIMMADNPINVLVGSVMNSAAEPDVRGALADWLQTNLLYWIRCERHLMAPRNALRLHQGEGVSKDQFMGQIHEQIIVAGSKTGECISIDVENPVDIPNRWYHSGLFCGYGQTRQPGIHDTAPLSVVALGQTNTYLVSYADGLLLLWRGEEVLASLLDVAWLDRTAGEIKLSEALGVSLSEQKEIIGRTPVTMIVAEGDRSFLALYKDGLLGRWTLPDDLVAQREHTGKPVELKSSGGHVFKTIADDIKTLIWANDGYMLLRQDGTLAHLDMQDALTNIALPLDEGESVSDLFYASSASVVVKIDASCGWYLRQYSTTAPNDLTWSSEALRLMPIVFGEPSLMIYTVAGGVGMDSPTCVEIFDPERGKSVSFGDQFPFGDFSVPRVLLRLAGQRCLGCAGGGLHVFDLSAGSVAKLDIDPGVVDVMEHDKDILTLHDDGMLRCWPPAILDSVPDESDEITDMLELPSGDILACSSGGIELWRDGPEKPSRTRLWDAASCDTGDWPTQLFLIGDDTLLALGGFRCWAFVLNEDTCDLVRQWEFCSRVGNCTVTTFGKDGFLLEYGVGPGERGRYLEQGTLRNGTSDSQRILLSKAQGYVQLLTPVMTDGDVLFRDVPHDLAEEVRFVLYNVRSHTEKYWALDDQELPAWLQEHRLELKVHLETVAAEVERFAFGLAFTSGNATKSLAGFATSLLTNSLGLLCDGVPFTDRPTDNIRALLTKLPASTELAIRDNRMLSDPLPGLAMLRPHANSKPLARAYNTGKLRVRVNRSNSTGRVYATDTEGRLHVLQLMKGMQPYATKNAPD